MITPLSLLLAIPVTPPLPSNVRWAFQANLPLDRTGIVDAAPVHGRFGTADARLLVPGDPERSMIYVRMGLAHEGRMPPLSSAVVDDQGRRLIAAWIRGQESHDPNPPPIPIRLSGENRSFEFCGDPSERK